MFVYHLLRKLADVLPKDRPLTVTMFGSAPLQITVDSTLTSGDVHVFSDFEPLREIANWVSQYRRHWEDSFDRLDEFLRDVQTRQEHGNGDHDDRDSNRPR